MKIIDRVLELIRLKSLSVRSFEQSIGASNGIISQAQRKDSDIQAKWLVNILEAYPDVNPAWLLGDDAPVYRNEVSLVKEENVLYGARKALHTDNIEKQYRELVDNQSRVILLLHEKIRNLESKIT